MDHTILALNKLSLNPAVASPTTTANNNFNYSDFTVMPSNKNSFFPTTTQIISPPPSPQNQQYQTPQYFHSQQQQQQPQQQPQMHLQENRGEENDIAHEPLGESPSALGRKFRNNPWIMNFINKMAVEESINTGLISTIIQTIYYDGANSLAIPHAQSQPEINSNIVKIIETWLTEHFSQAGDSIPILGDTLENNMENICQRIRTELKCSGLKRVLVNIRAGHSFFSHMKNDEIVLDENQIEFFSRFPLFVTIFIKVESKSTYTTTDEDKCQVLVAIEHVTKKTQFAPLSSANYNNNNNNNNDLVTLSPDGQILCSLEEMSNNYHFY